MSVVVLTDRMCGDWVSFAAHLVLKEQLPLFQVTRSIESTQDQQRYRDDFGYGVKYRILSVQNIVKRRNLLVAFAAESHVQILGEFPPGTRLVIHDRNQVELVKALSAKKLLTKFVVITVQQSVKTFLQNQYNICSTYVPRPFFPFHRIVRCRSSRSGSISISRMQRNQKIELILMANRLLHPPNRIRIFSSLQRQTMPYAFEQMDLQDDFQRSYQGSCRTKFDEVSKILSGADFFVDLTRQHCSGDLQYTFLEAIYEGCVLIVNRACLPASNLRPNLNCLAASSSKELADILRTPHNMARLRRESLKLLKRHLEADWSLT